MKIKPKEIFVNLPIVLTDFADYHDIPAFASNINAIIHGKVKVKYEELGMLGPNYVAIFYLYRNGEYQELRKEFVDLINEEEMQRD